MVVLSGCGALRGQGVVPVPYIYTETPRYDSAATLKGGERFPAGAALQLVTGGRKRALAPGFAASADATVSFDGQRVLFSAKQKPGDPWQIWEIPVSGGAARCIVSAKEDAIAPFYLPGDRIVYSRRTPAGFQLVSVALDGGAPLQLTYGPGNRVASDVLRDGRILFEAAHDLYTVYSDGSGVESYRCDHGPDRRGARQLSSGDIVFETVGRLARFTSARAVQLPLTLPKGEYAGPVAELSPECLAGLLSTRCHVAIRALSLASRGGFAAEGPGAGCRSGPAGSGAAAARSQTPPLRAGRSPGGQPAVPERVHVEAADRRRFRRQGARLGAQRRRFRRRCWARRPSKRTGRSLSTRPPKPPSASNCWTVPAKIIAAEKGWFWARRGEQRVCVGCHAGPERAPENAVPQVLLRSTEPVKLTGEACCSLPTRALHGGVE